MNDKNSTHGKKRIGIAGESDCGKTTLAIHLSRAMWTTHRTPSLVLDLWAHEHNWQVSSTVKQAWVTKSEEKFRDAIIKKPGCLVIIDDGSVTINRDRDKLEFFTTIRHHAHHLICICHGPEDLLPGMRRNFNELFLFAQTVNSVKMWQESLPSMQGIARSTSVDGHCDLKDYEFLWCRKHKDAEIKKLNL